MYCFENILLDIIYQSFGLGNKLCLVSCLVLPIEWCDARFHDSFPQGPYLNECGVLGYKMEINMHVYIVISMTSLAEFEEKCSLMIMIILNNNCCLGQLDHWGEKPKKYVLISSGNLFVFFKGISFQLRGATTEKALVPTEVLTRETCSWSRSLERSACTFRDGSSIFQIYTDRPLVKALNNRQ